VKNKYQEVEKKLQMMPKVLSIFMKLILIFKIAFSSKWTTITIDDLNSTNKQNIETYNFVPSTHFGNTNLIKIQSNSKLKNLLIFLSSDKFKYCILPYLSSHNFVKIYLHFQNLVPELNFEKFLPPSRFYTKYNVLDIQEPRTYLQPLEINLLYKCYGKYSSLEPHILYSSKNKLPISCKPHIPISPNSICAHLSHNTIISYETYVIQTSHQELLILRNDESNQFFVTFENSKGQFINIAKCNRVLEIEFPDYIECIWEAYNLKCWEKYYWKMKSFLNMPYEKYLHYVVKIISYLMSRIDNFSDIFEYIDNVCLLNFILRVALLGAIVTNLFLWYFATLLPFFILTFSLNYFIFDFNFSYLFLISQGLSALYVFFFPQIKKSMPFRTENIIEIEPHKLMSVVSLLVQKRIPCKVEFPDTLRFCYLIFLFGLPVTLFFTATQGPLEILIVILIGLFFGGVTLF